ncbi:hypothetical protein AMTR_s00168p00036950 [Amborella trichopoda]|uniref:Uncharacterized protein n=1 Tax=Amborella trichopoda TaxID=13333 RepID=W1PQV9_AMBTC|nr:hypothetical protein AMTR_s00168p00036950 [Amborella trichopoda]
MGPPAITNCTSTRVYHACISISPLPFEEREREREEKRGGKGLDPRCKKRVTRFFTLLAIAAFPWIQRFSGRIFR